ncbi:Alpha/Beta hydrolase protein [Geopyxis carbonaria]|nr:Alpha/Beta hydrolase protein [Geopyxis carbonaria]
MNIWSPRDIIQELITNFGFPGVAEDHSGNPDKRPSNLIQHFKNSENIRIEYIPIIEEGSDIILFVSAGRLRGLDTKSVNQWVKLAKDDNTSIVLHNYPGYGGTSRELTKSCPTTQSRITNDCLELLNHIREQPWATGKQIVLVGNSIGCGPTIWLAINAPEGAVSRVVLVSPYTSLYAVLIRWMTSGGLSSVQLGWLVDGWLGGLTDVVKFQFLQKRKTDPFPALEMVKSDRMRDLEVLVVHGVADTTIPIKNGREIAAALKDSGAKVTVCEIPHTGHRHTRILGNDVIKAFAKGEGQGAVNTAIKKVVADAEAKAQAAANRNNAAQVGGGVDTGPD